MKLFFFLLFIVGGVWYYVVSSQTTQISVASKESIATSKNKSQDITPKIATKPDVAKEEIEKIEETEENEGSFSTEVSAKTTLIQHQIESLNTLVNATVINRGKREKQKQEILTLVKENTQALATMIANFEDAGENRLLQDALFDILATIKDPEVESLGLRLVDAEENRQKILGLDLLAHLAIPNAKTLARTSAFIKEDDLDVEVLLSAIHAMPAMMVSEEKRADILNDYKHLLSHQDATVRSESLFALSKWSKNATQLQPVIDALSHTNTDDKISAMMAIESSPIVSVSLKEMLLEKMMNKTVLSEIRAMSANALKRFDLTTDEFEHYKEYTQGD